MQWCVRIRERETHVELLDPISFLTESYVARLGTKIDYEAAGGSVPNFQASTGPVVVGGFGENQGFADLRSAAVCEG